MQAQRKTNSRLASYLRLWVRRIAKVRQPRRVQNIRVQSERDLPKLADFSRALDQVSRLGATQLPRFGLIAAKQVLDQSRGDFDLGQACVALKDLSVCLLIGRLDMDAVAHPAKEGGIGDVGDGQVRRDDEHEAEG